MLTDALAVAASPTKAWIDQPLPGAVLVFGPTPVTVHAASDSGIAKVRFLVDGNPTATVPAPGGDLVTVTWTWVPVSAGEHLLTAVADAVDGIPSDPVSVAVTFVGRDELPPSAPPLATGTPGSSPGASGGATTAPGATPTAGPTGGQSTPTPLPTSTSGATPAPTRTPGPTAAPTLAPTPPPTAAPTPTPTSTPVPCTPPAPDLLFPSDGAALNEATPTFEWAYFDGTLCPPSSFRVDISESRTFDTIAMQGIVAGDQFYWTSDPGLIACVTYSWRVVPLGGVVGTPSVARTFHLIGRECP
jgi:hypothetical protein